MEKFINKYQEEIQGTLSGFDRLVFRGSLRRLFYGHWDRGLQSMVVEGMERYLGCNHILFKHYLDHVKGVSQKVKQASVKPFQEQGLPVRFLRDPAANKEQIARAIAAEKKVESGLVCALSSMELSPSFEHRGTHIVSRLKPCQIVYQYQIHPQVGWMYARIKNWFPFNVQVGLNGREWLARQMDQGRLKYRQQQPAGLDDDYAARPMKTDADPAGGDELDGFAERFWRAVEPAARQHLRELHGRLLLDVLPVGVGHGHRIRQGRLPEAFDAVAGAAWHAQLFQCRRDEVLRQEGESVRSHSGGLQRYRWSTRSGNAGSRAAAEVPDDTGNSPVLYDKAYSEFGSVPRGSKPLSTR